MSMIDPILDTFESVFAWLGSAIKMTAETYCDLQTADSSTSLVAHDGSLISIVRIEGAKGLIGQDEFNTLYQGLSTSLSASMSRSGHRLQFFFNYDLEAVSELIQNIYRPAEQTAGRIGLNLSDLFSERVSYLSDYCAHENVFLAIWTCPHYLNKEQFKQAKARKLKSIREEKIPPFSDSQNVVATISELREVHDAFVRAIGDDLERLNLASQILEVHEALRHIRMTVDPDFTDHAWRPILPGDKVPVRLTKSFKGNISDLLWPSLARQLLPREAENLDLRTCRIGGRIYSSVFIDLFPKDIKPFMTLFNRVLNANIPWRISFSIASDASESVRLKSALASVLSFSSSHNRLLADASNLVRYLNINTDDAIVKLQVAAVTWAPENNLSLLRTRTSELAKAIEGWGSCDVSEVCGDPFLGVVSSMLTVSSTSVATASVAPLSDVAYLLPITRPASPWSNGALLFRSPEGKPWPYQPGSNQQTTWIDLMYARPGSGKSVLSNAINLALCLSGGQQRLPRISVIDIGPSSSGLISLLKEALPQGQKHQAAYHRLRMTPDYAINPFDTQLGCRFPTPQERSFLVNFLTLLATPIGSNAPYDGISDMAGLVVDELYKSLSDAGQSRLYTAGIEPLLDGILDEIGFIQDQRTTWWEITDALFTSGFVHEAMLAQRYAMPLMADATSVCRTGAIEDLYGKVIAPTGENLIAAFSRMISSAVREYPILSRITSFDIGDARVVSLDLDEVAKGGGEAGERQTAVMYMLARYVLARHYYLTEDTVRDISELYRAYHLERVTEIREDAKRIVYDEFHRTSSAKAVREQILTDMREGRKWKVQIALISQSLEDFDPIMVEFATAIYIMDAGPEQAIKKTVETFGLSETARIALRNRVHGPREGGATFLAQFSTKEGMNTQLLTLTLGPIELWAFSTTAEDAMLRNRLYERLGAEQTRRLLARFFPTGSVAKLVEQRLSRVKEKEGFITEDSNTSIIEELMDEILTAYSKHPNFKFD